MKSYTGVPILVQLDSVTLYGFASDSVEVCCAQGVSAVFDIYQENPCIPSSTSSFSPCFKNISVFITERQRRSSDTGSQRLVDVSSVRKMRSKVPDKDDVTISSALSPFPERIIPSRYCTEIPCFLRSFLIFAANHLNRYMVSCSLLMQAFLSGCPRCRCNVSDFSG